MYHLLGVFLLSRADISTALFGEQTEERGRGLVQYTVQPFSVDPRELEKQLTKEEDIMYTFQLTALWLINEVR